MVKKYALIDLNSIVLNIIVWDGESEYKVGKETYLVPISENSLCGIGFTYNKLTNEFEEPNQNPDVAAIL